MAAQAFGARDPHRMRRALRTGLWAGLADLAADHAVSFYGERILLALGQAPSDRAPRAAIYLGLVWGVAPALWFMAVRGFMGAVDRPQPALWITLAGDPGQCTLGVSLDLRRMGISATGIVRRGACHLRSQFRYLCWRRCGLRRACARSGSIMCSRTSGSIDKIMMRQLVAIGAPISLSLMLEYGLFSSAALLMGLISTARTGGAPGRAADHRDPVHGALWHQPGGNGAGRARGRPGRPPTASNAPASWRCCSASPDSGCSRCWWL